MSPRPPASTLAVGAALVLVLGGISVVSWLTWSTPPSRELPLAKETAAPEPVGPPHADRGTRTQPQRSEDTPDELSAALERRQLAREARSGLHGRVTDGAGQPVLDAVLYCDGHEIARSDAHGEYRCEFARKVYGYADRRPRLAPILAAHPEHGAQSKSQPPYGGALDFVLDTAPPLDGLVVDAQGQAVPRAEVLVHVTPDLPDASPIEAGTLRVECTGAGRFRVPGLGSTHLRLEASAGNLRTKAPYFVTTRADRATTVRLELQLARCLRGSFTPWPFGSLDPSRASVSVVTDRALPEVSATVDAKGRFEVLLPQRHGSGLLALRDENGEICALHEFDASFVDEAADLGLLELAPPTTVYGRLALGDLATLAGLELEAWLHAGGLTVRHRVPISADGSFEMPRFGNGGMSLGLLVAGQFVTPIQLAQPLRENLGDLAIPQDFLLGRVVDELGRGIGGVTVDFEVLLEDGRSPLLARGESSVDGSYVLRRDPDPAPQAPHRLSARLPGRHLPALREFDGAPSRTVVADLVLHSGQVLYGHVRRSDGTPLAGLTVEATGADGEPRFDWSDAEGFFRLDGLASLEVALTIRSADGSPLRPRANRTGSTVEIVLDDESP